MTVSVVDRIRLSGRDSALLLRQAEQLCEKAQVLPAEERRLLPQFGRNWSHESLTRYLQQLEAAVEQPLVQHARESLSAIGLDPSSASSEALANYEKVEELVTGVRQLKDQAPDVADALVQGHIQPCLADSIEEAVDNVREALEHQDLLVTIVDRVQDGDIQRQLIAQVLHEQERGKVRDVLPWLERLQQLGVVVPPDTQFARLFDDLQSASGLLDDLQALSGFTRDDDLRLLSGESLDCAIQLLREQLNKCRNEYRQLLEEFGDYARRLDIQSQAPTSVPKLRDAVDEMRQGLREKWGEGELLLYEFMCGRQGFPDSITVTEVRSVLETLLPEMKECLSGVGEE